MKRLNNLYDSICSISNLYEAYSKARKGKSKSYGVQKFEENLDTNINQIYCELISGTYKTSEYKVFSIFEPKERIVYRLPFRDRVVHHAIMNVLESIWVPIFITHTYSCIKGRGIHKALKHIRRDLKDYENTHYCLKLDIRKFYPSINHNILKDIVRKKIKDLRLLSLLDGIIDSAPGLPIGNYLSQYLANLYLTYFDHWLKENIGVKYYYRYADDMVILSSDKDYLHQTRLKIRDFLQQELELDLKSNYQIFPVDTSGIDFIGYVFFHSHILLRKRIKKNLCKKVAKLEKQNAPLRIYKRSICSHLGWAKHCNSRNLMKSIIKNEEMLISLHLK